MIALQRELSPTDLGAVAVGRSLVADSLRDAGPDVVDDAVLAVSELLTNAICAARDCVRLVIDLAADTARLEVFDDGPGDPRVGVGSPHRTGGRGLAIVETVSRDWGVRLDPPGKWVWATFPCALPAPTVTSASRGAVA